MDSEDIMQYLEVGYGEHLAFDPAGESLAFVLHKGATHRVLSIDGSGEGPDRVVDSPNQISALAWSPARQELASVFEGGGDDPVQLYLIDPEDGECTPLTKTPEAYNLWGSWSPSGDRIAFLSNRCSSPGYAIYVTSRNPSEEPELVKDPPGWFTIADWSPAGDELLVSVTQSSYDEDLFRLSLDDNSFESITPTDTARYTSVNWTSSRHIYLCTNLGSETFYLGRLDTSTGTVEEVHGGGKWNVEGVVVNVSSDRLAFVRNVDGISELTVGRLDDPLTVRDQTTVTLPKGVIQEGTFGPDGKMFAFLHSSPTDIWSIYVLDTDTGCIERWYDATTSASNLDREQLAEPDIIRYVSFDGREIPALFSVPNNETSRVPAVVDLHGGPAKQRRPEFRPFRQCLLDSGIAVLEPNVRGSTGYGKTYTHLDDRRNRLDAVRDVAAAADWLNDHSNVASNRIGVYGRSAGGLLALLVLEEFPSLWAAGVDVAGITDVVSLIDDARPEIARSHEREYGSLEEDRDFLERISPIHHVDCIEAPVLVVHTEDDTRVPFKHSRRLVATMKEQGVPVATEFLPDGNHRLTDNKTTVYRSIISFLAENL